MSLFGDNVVTFGIWISSQKGSFFSKTNDDNTEDPKPNHNTKKEIEKKSK